MEGLFDIVSWRSLCGIRITGPFCGYFVNSFVSSFTLVQFYLFTYEKSDNSCKLKDPTLSLNNMSLTLKRKI